MIDTQITKYCSDMVADVFRPAVAQYAKALCDKYGIKHDEAMMIWDNMNPDAFSISAIKSNPKIEKADVKKTKKKRTTPAKASAWREYANEKRPSVKAQLAAEGLEGKELFGATAKRLGSNWKAMSDEEKKPYQDRANKKNDDSCSENEEEKESEIEISTPVMKKSKKASQKKAQSMKKSVTPKKLSHSLDDGEGEGSEDESFDRPPSPPARKMKSQNRTPISDDEEELSEEE